MTITVSLEELRQFEEDYKRWVRRDEGAFLTVFQNLTAKEKDSISDLAKRALADSIALRLENEKRYPEPKLIPSV